MDCTVNCRSKHHADYITALASNEDVDQIKSSIFLKCCNPLRNSDSFGRILLHIAATHGKQDLIEWIKTEHKIENFLFTKDRESGWSALHRSLYYGHLGCAISLAKMCPEWRPLDHEGLNPLDLVIFDSPRVKKPKKANRLVTVVQPFEAAEAGELTLNVGDVVEVLHANRSGWGVGRKYATKDRGLFPLTFVENAKEQESSPVKLWFEPQRDLYSWGVNVNFTLGLGDGKNRLHPELIESVWSNCISVENVVITKFHMVILTTSNSVFTCGHGLGGRLGHGEEETILYPRQIRSLKDVCCVAVAAAHNHTLILDEMGLVYTCGINDFGQLGHVPAPKKLLTPTIITAKSTKGRKFIGAAAGRFHSVIYSKDEMFAFGLNAGQLGLPKGEELQLAPKPVSQIPRLSQIALVSASDGATACLLHNGDVFVLQDYVCKKIAAKMLDVISICMTGGQLEAISIASLAMNDPLPLRIVVLHDSGMVNCWMSGYKSFKKCSWVGRKLNCVKVIDISLGKQLLVTTSDGQAFYGHFSTAAVRSGTQKAEASRLAVLNEPQTSLSKLLDKIKQDRQEMETVQLERIPLLGRAVKCACDPKGRSFACIQSDARDGCRSCPSVRGSSLEADLACLLVGSALTDNIHDMEIKTKGAVLPAHIFMMAARLTDYQSVLGDKLKSAGHGKHVLDWSKCDEMAVLDWLKAIYQGKSVSNLPESVTQTSSTLESLKNSRNCLVKVQDQTTHSSDDVASPISVKEITLLDIAESARNVQTYCGVNSKMSAFQVSEQRKQKFVGRKGKKTRPVRKTDLQVQSCLDRKKMTEFADVILVSEDGMLFPSHKCVLVSRLEYFHIMLSNEWVEASNSGSLSLAVPGRVLDVLLEFLYTDGVRCLENESDVSFIGEVIVFSDQLLILRLKDLCELALAKKISLKNAVEMFEFSCLYSAEQLKRFCCEFISMNLPYFLEARLLENVNQECLDQLSTVYRAMVSGMEGRKVSPSTYHLDVEKRTQFVQEETAAFLVKLKLKKQRRFSQEKADHHPAHGSSVRGAATSCSLAVGGPHVAGARRLSDAVNSAEKAAKESKPNVDPLDHPDRKHAPVSSPNRPAWPQMAVSAKSLAAGDSVECSPTNRLSTQKTFKKLSQKQRKKERLSVAFAAPDSSCEVPEERKPSRCPWTPATASPSISLPVSFREVMALESSAALKQSASNQSPKNSDKTPLSTPERSERRPSNEKPAAKQEKVSTWGPPSSSGVANSVVADEKPAFSRILFDQQLEKSRLLSLEKKPLSLIQIEERAMDELRSHYVAANAVWERITVERVPAPSAIPVWKVDDS